MDNLYFFCPSSAFVADDFFPVPSRQRRDTRDTNDDVVGSDIVFNSSDRLNVKLFKDDGLDLDESMQEVGWKTSRFT